MVEQNTDVVLAALLDADIVPEKDVHMKRLGVDFRVKAIDNKTLSRIRQQATFGKKSEIDRDKFFALIVVHGCITPNWADPVLVSKFGPTPADVVNNRLLPGEITKLAEEILSLSGFSDDEEDIEEIKN